jgi:preprotein translocase subunit SecF
MFFVSVGLMITAIILLVMWGLRFGVDFRGGSELELTFSQRPAIADLTSVLTKLDIPELKDVGISPIGTVDVVIRSDTLTEDQHQTVIRAVDAAFPDVHTTEARFDSIGPVIGNELKSKAVSAIVTVLIAIALYIAVVFRGMRRTLSWWVMSFATMVALAHDVLLPLGVFALLGHFKGVEISAVFVAAILTIMGYSISDTVVVFDRVRENIVKGRLGREVSFAEAVHRSIMQTLVRSINTNITTLLSLVAIFLFGGASIKYFALALIVGIFSGAYSSIFIASPLLVWMGRRSR